MEREKETAELFRATVKGIKEKEWTDEIWFWISEGDVLDVY